MKAKEMFEKLGYEIAYDNKYNIRYHNVKKDNYIWFMLDTKTIDIIVSYISYETINMKELQAINQQVEELHWND